MSNTAMGASARTYFFSNREINVILYEDMPWFLACDVCALLDFNDVRQACSHLDEDEIALFTIDSLEKLYRIETISESGFYALMSSSGALIAKSLKLWVTQRLLPDIRRFSIQKARKLEPHLRPVSDREPLNTLELGDLRCLIGMTSAGFVNEHAVIRSVWHQLRTLLKNPAPYPFFLDQLPTISAEMKRIVSITAETRGKIEALEEDAVRRIFGNTYLAENVLASFRKTARKRQDSMRHKSSTLTKWMRDCVMMLINQRGTGY